MKDNEKFTEEKLVHKTFSFIFDNCEILGRYVESLCLCPELYASKKLCERIVKRHCPEGDWLYLTGYILTMEECLELILSHQTYLTEFDICGYLGVDVPDFTKRKTFLFCKEDSTVRDNPYFEALYC